MSLVADFSLPKSHFASTSEFFAVSEKAFAIICDAAPSRKPWSTVEASLSTEDIEWLKAWLAHPDMPRLLEKAETSLINIRLGVSYEVIVGLLLLTLYAEVVRRDGSEGNYWGVASRLWPESHTPGWFNGQGATARHRQVLEEAACKLQLRNVFSEEGTSEWYVSGFLQFAFTRRGFENHLPEWLAGLSRGGVTRAMGELIFGAKNRSTSFYQLISELSGLKSGNVSESRLRDTLSKSPWVLPEWHERLITKAKESAKGGGAYESTDSEDFLEAYKPDFLSEPRLEITSEGRPVFRVRLQHLLEFEMIDSEYEVTLGGKAVRTLVRQPDGSYFPAAGGYYLDIPWTTDVTDAELRSKTTGTALHTIGELRCWDPTLHIQAWSSEGIRFESPDVLKLRQGQTFHLLAVADLKPSTMPPGVRTVTAGAWTLYLNIPANASLTLTFPEDAEPFWKLQEAIAPESRAKSECAGVAVSSYCKRSERTHRLEGCLGVLGLPPGAEIEAVWFNLESLPKPTSPASISVPLWDSVTKKERLGVPCSVRIKVRLRGEVFSITRQVSFATNGVLWKGEAGYIRSGACEYVTLREIMRRTVSLRADEDSKALREHGVVMEGHRIVAPIAKSFDKPVRLTGLDGIGAKLQVYRRNFNDPVTDDAFCLAKIVVDNGLMTRVDFEEGKLVEGEYHAPRLVVTLPYGIPELHGVSWGLLYRDEAKAVRFDSITLTAGNPDRHGRATWVAPATQTGSFLAVVAVSGNTPVAHAWFNGALECALKTPESGYDEVSLERLAKALRTLKAPIRMEGMTWILKAFISRHADTVLPLWIAPRCDWREGDLMLVRNDDELAWQRAIGSATRKAGLRIAPELAKRILATQDFESATTDDSVFRAACRLADISPRLCAEVLRSHFDTHPKGRDAKARLLKDMTPSKETLLERQPRGSCVDENFINTTMGKLREPDARVLDSRDSHNIRVLLNLPHPAFRRKAVCLILEAIR